MMRKASLLWSLLLAGVLLLAYADPCLAIPEKNTSQVKITLPFVKEDLSIEKQGEYDRVSLKDAALPEDEPGTPWLPASFVNVRVPDGAKVVSVSVDVLKETLIAKDLNVYPVQPSVRGNQPAPAFVKPNAAAYKSKAKKELGKSGNPQQMREYTFVPVRINPVRLIAATGELYLAETVEITVEYQTNLQATPAKAKGKRKADPFENMMKKLVVNPDISFKTSDAEAQTAPSSEPIPSVESAPAPEPAIEQILLPASAEYLIITSSDLAASFQALANHRAAFNGVTTKILTTATIYASYAGVDSQQKIRACIFDHKENHGTLYVLLGGTGTIVPGRKMTVNGRLTPSDLYYAGLDTNWDNLDGDSHYGENLASGTEGDLLADVFVGRIPLSSTTQVTQYISKLIKYEKTPPAGIEKKFMINGAIANDSYTGDNRPSDLMNDGHLAFRSVNHPKVSDAEMWMRRLYRDCVQVHGWQASKFGVLMDTLTSWDSSTGGDYAANASNTVTRFDEGWNFVFHSTHGFPNYFDAETDTFTNTHAADLTGLTTIFCTDACEGGKWTSSGSISAAMLANPNGGALAYLGHVDFNWYTSDSAPASNTSTGGIADAYPRAFAKAVFGDRMPYLGQAFVAHQFKMYPQASVENTSNWCLDTMYGISLLGDPLFPVRTEVTRPLLATHPKFVKPNQPFVLHLTRDGVPVNGSTVRIWNANERYEAITNANGDAAFTLPAVSAIEMSIVATAPNSFPYQGELYVQLNEAPVVLATATDAAASETGSDPGTWTFSRSDNIASSLTVSFSLGGNATQGSDYTVPSISSLTFPAGVASAVLTLTPVDDSVIGELTETATLTLLPNSAYAIAQSPMTISIADNDNMPPLVNASQDQLAYIKKIPWTPSDDLTKLTTSAWYDAADPSSITQTGGYVSTWKDKSGNDKHATQTISSVQPASGGAINGVQALSFQADDWMKVPSIDFPNRAFLMFVAQPLNEDIYSVVGSQLHYDVYEGLSNYAKVFRSDLMQNPIAIFPVNGAFMGAYEANSAVPFYNVYSDGTQKVNSTTAFTFSDNWTGIGSKMVGKIGEIMALDYVPSTETRQKIEGYLAHKWSLASKLPAGHMYLNAPPMVDRVTVQLVGTASDVENDALVITWSKVSGPGTVTFANASAASTQATFNVEGVYTLRLSVNDGTSQTTDDVVITVKKSNFPVGKAIGFETAEGYPAAVTQIAPLNGAATNAPFNGIKGWSRSTSNSISRAVATSNSGEYTSGQALATDGAGSYIGGLKGVILPDDVSTITFDAQYGSIIAVGFMKDADGDGLFDNTDAGMGFGVGGTTSRFQRRNAAFGTETASPLAGTAGQWYRFKVTIGSSVAGSRAVTMAVRNLTSSTNLDFETATAGVQTWSFSVTDAAFGPAPESADGVFVRLTAASKIDNLLVTAAQPSSVAIVDADIDGMDDAWETTYFGGTGVSNGSGDSDGDGFTDLQEYRCGTNPKDSNSLLKIASTTTISKTEMVLTFNAVAGKTYKLLASSDLTASSWQPIQTGIIGVSPTTSVTVPITGGSKFFIIGVE